MLLDTKLFKKEELLKFLPLVIIITLLILFFIFIFIPLKRKLDALNINLKSEKENFSLVERTAKDIDKIKLEIKSLKDKVSRYEKNLPLKKEAMLLIDTLKDITQESKIKFVSFEPQPVNKFDIPRLKNQYYLELPIKMRLKCGFYELINFLKEIEASKKLIKATNIKITTDPHDIWEHTVELTISTYAIES